MCIGCTFSPFECTLFAHVTCADTHFKQVHILVPWCPLTFVFTGPCCTETICVLINCPKLIDYDSPTIPLGAVYGCHKPLPICQWSDLLYVAPFSLQHHILLTHQNKVKATNHWQWRSMNCQKRMATMCHNMSRRTKGCKLFERHFRLHQLYVAPRQIIRPGKIIRNLFS